MIKNPKKEKNDIGVNDILAPLLLPPLLSFLSIPHKSMMATDLLPNH
jgi:hypothetical protein